MRSWSKWKIFSRRTKSSSKTRPRARARACLELVLVVGNPNALVGRQDIIIPRLLMRFPAISRAVFDFVFTGHVGPLRIDRDMVHQQRIRLEKDGTLKLTSEGYP